jgi:hypothetical protein
MELELILRWLGRCSIVFDRETAIEILQFVELTSAMTLPRKGVQGVH